MPRLTTVHRRAVVVCVALAALVAIVFAPLSGYDFIGFDDDVYVYNNEWVKSGLTAEGVRRAFTEPVSAHWHPLTMISYEADASIFGMWAGGFHLTNVVLHGLNTVLLFLVLRSLTGSFRPSSFAAVLFAIHPLHVEPVAWIASRKDVLSAFFWFACIAAYGWYVKTGGPWRFFVVAWLLILGLLAKSILMTMPFFLLLLDYWPLGRVTAEDTRTVEGRKRIAGMLIEKALLVPVVAVVLLLNVRAQHRGGNINTLEQTSLGERFGNALHAYAAYLSDFVWPSGLGAYYPMPSGGHPVEAIAAAAILVGGITFAAVALWRSAPYLFVGWFWFIGTLVPVIGLVQLGAQSRADRYMYVPLAGLAIAVVWGGSALLKRWPHMRRGAVALALAAIAGYGSAAALQMFYWQNSETIFRRTLAVTHDNYLIHYNLALELGRSGRIDEAIQEYEAAIAVFPEHPESHNNLGGILAQRGSYAEAAAHFETALNGRPQNAAILCNLAMVYVDVGDIPRARHFLDEAKRIAPDAPLTKQAAGFVEAAEK